MNTQFIDLPFSKEHPIYKIMELSGQALSNKLATWSRLDLINWLPWIDKNGIYSDEDSKREFDNILSKEEATEIMMRQISESQ